MPTPSPPISSWLGALQRGEAAAAQPLWEHYFAQLVALAAHKLQGTSRRVADEEDVALSAFHSFCEGVAQQRFPQLADRHDLWRLLLTITGRKAADLAQSQRRLKRGAGRVRGDSAFAGLGDDAGWEQVVGREPTPALAAQVTEQLARLLEALGDATLQAIALGKLEGYSNEQLAARLEVTPRTIERKLALIRRIWTADHPS